MKNTHKLKTMLTIAALTITSMASAAETISILWGFSIGSNQASTLRIMSDEANKAQSKYNFIVESKAGAGGSIAANHVLQHPNITLVGMSSSFFIRPAVETIGIHDLAKFKPILIQGTGAPVSVISKKYKNINELLKQENPSVGISGQGSISDMLANVLKEKNPNLTIVNFKGMVDASVAAAGGHIDAAIVLPMDAKAMVDANEVSIIGYTGITELADHKGLMLTKQGIPAADKLVANYAIFVSTDMATEKYREIHEILSKAAKTDRVIDSYKKDLIAPVNIPLVKSMDWYNSERQYWSKTANRLIKR
jgi:tripartite-type tricarboxylate transporter receptor subunit TctC